MRKNDTLNKIASWHIHQFITDLKMLGFIFELVKMYREVKKISDSNYKCFQYNKNIHNIYMSNDILTI